MSRRHGGWGERVPRPKVADLPKESLQRLHARAVQFVEGSVILHHLVHSVELSRGRLHIWWAPGDLMARITPLAPRSMLLETPRRNSWVEHKRGQLSTVLKVVEEDDKGSFHGLGSLVAKERGRGAHRSAQVVLHRDLQIPVPVLAEPRYWYSMHRRPVIAEIGVANDRALVRFVGHGMSTSFHGTCLYALRDGEWGCYTIKPNASKTIAAAEAWLQKRGWEEWS